VRKILFWSHLILGIVAGVLIFSMCVTGVLLTFERQTLDWADRGDAHAKPQPGAARLPLADLIAKSGAKPNGIVVHSDPAEPVELSLGRDKTLYVNPYTGAVAGERSKRAHEFFEGLRAWHRWFTWSSGSHKVSQSINDAANVACVFVLLSGPFLWWPKKFTLQHLRPIIWFRGGLSGKARDFNWHNALGLWANIPLFFIALTGVVLSYPWANDLLYSMTGSEKPRAERMEPIKKGEGPPTWQGVDAWVAQASARKPDWNSITIRNTPTKNISMSIDWGTGGQPQKRATLTLDRVSNTEVKWSTFADSSMGVKLRAVARTGHTGEMGGIFFQLVAGLMSLAGAVLVYTGFALSLRRFAAWRRRKARPVEMREAA